MTAGITIGLTLVVAMQAGVGAWLINRITSTFTLTMRETQDWHAQQIAELTHRVQVPNPALINAVLASPQEDSQTTQKEIELPIPGDLDWPPDPDEFRGDA